MKSTPTRRARSHPQNEGGGKLRPRSAINPIQPVNVVAPEGLRYLSQEDVTPAAVGHKAFGLACLPSGWTQPFFVVTSECDFAQDMEVSAAGRSLRGHLREATEQLGITLGTLLIVRSSGVAETLSRRGSHESWTCRPDQLAATLRELKARITAADAPGIHWVVQIKVDTRALGFLSNVRRVQEEPRDWIVQFDQHPPEVPETHLEPLSVRQWRDGALFQADRLPCRSRAELASALKQVAQWGMQFTSRLHFEWVWDGSYLYALQADVDESPHGVDPRTLVPRVTKSAKARSDALHTRTLRVFRRASRRDCASFQKLRNAALYRKLGYSMPPFYILNDKATFRSILVGDLPPRLLEDLKALTVQPLVIRVDGRNLAAEKREMLPRSDELRSPEDAAQWLTSDFAAKIRSMELEASGVCLIAHHFLPAVASAWARAEPNARWVRIESLWGVPEGLYWFSHDTFEVDTIETDPRKVGHIHLEKFETRERPRFKGIFVAPNHDGEWVTHNTRAPYDWRRSITKDSWLREIAATTRKIGVAEQAAVSVMWLVDLRHPGIRHAVLPWYHSRSISLDTPRAAPLRKISSHRDFTVRNVDDWERLKELAAARGIDRVRVEPTDVHLIRNPEFATGIAHLATEYGFVVELAGGLLSHIYYALRRHGCNVECVDLYGADRETLVFNKVVRDHVPTQIQQGGEHTEVLRLRGAALDLALKRKLVEEALEVLDAAEPDAVRGELADVMEVVFAIMRHVGLRAGDIDSARARKNKQRGAFDKGLMLVKTSTPHSLATTDSLQITQELPATSESGGDHEGGWAGLASVPSAHVPVSSQTRLPVKPDLRAVAGGLEKLVSFAVDVSSLQRVRGLTTFIFPVAGQPDGPQVTLEIDLRRFRNEIKGTIRIRTAPSQFAFDFHSED
jgi:predicted house-cleaning noncanonical NTP pyrophosphatase (MazG superfamily)